ncbi:MAG: hypothetical protein JWP02_3785, partial [Acidimicrobiales bacterium]|nr:hypothetical protein [Acidimicrobiales bacterium]
MIFGSIGLLAAAITNSNTGLLVGSIACTVVSRELLLITNASPRRGAANGAQT